MAELVDVVISIMDPFYPYLNEKRDICRQIITAEEEKFLSTLASGEKKFEAIAEKAMEKDTGARALRSIIEEFMLDIMYEIPKDDNIGQVTITGAYIEGTGGPIIDIRNNSVGIEERKKLNEIRE